MALEVMDLHDRLCERFDMKLNDQVVSRIKGLGPDEATHLVRLCSESETSSSLNLLGFCSAKGIGVPQDRGRAIEYYTKSAHLGNPVAMTNLGNCLHMGDGVERNVGLAVEWYRKSSQRGNSRAMSYLGARYETGVGVEKDEKLAVEWYRQAADLGDPAGMKDLGRCLEDGIGVERNVELAVEWYRKSADLGDRVAMSNLGRCLNHGIGTTKNEESAIEWYTRANTHTSLWNLGMLLQHRSPDEAIVALGRSCLLAGTDGDRTSCRDKIVDLMVESSRYGAVDLLLEKIRGDQRNETLQRENQALRTEVDTLNTELETLRTELEFRPGGPGFERVRDDFHAKVRRDAMTSLTVPCSRLVDRRRSL